jgi:hypothetical protein
MRKQILMAAVAMATTASLATAQLGRETFFIDLETPTQGNNTHLGCAYGLVNGFIYTSGRGLGATTTGPHTIYTWDNAGNVTTAAQPAASNATVWGYRDGASSLVGQVFFGWDGGIDVYDADPVTGALTPATNLLAGVSTPLTPLAAGAPGTITSGVVGGTHRAIAFNFFGNNNAGSFFVANFGGSVYEIDAAGNVLFTFPNTSTAVWSAYGLAIDDKGDGDETNDTLWINSSPNQGKLVEYSIDRVNSALTPTGLEIERNQPGTAQGGLALVPGGLDGRNCGHDLIGVDQGTPDALTGYRVVQWDGYQPADEPRFLVGTDGGPLTSGVADVFSTTATIDFDVVSAGTFGLPYFLFFDLAGGTARPPGPIPGIIGDVVWELSHPRLSGVLVGAFTAGVPTQFPNFLGTQPVGTEIEWQAFAIDLAAPATACGKNLTFVGLPWSTTTFGGHVLESNPLPCLTNEDFEGTVSGVGNYPAGWSDGGGLAQWSSDDAGTPSGATGPTAAVSGSQYMYCETSAPNTAATFNMNTRVYTAAEIAGGQVAFQLSRVGATVGTLNVLMDDGINPPVQIATYTGAAATEWTLEIVTLPSIPPGGASFQFNYTAGGGFTGDIAIDDFCTL